MANRGTLTVRLAMNMCSVDLDEMPDDGMVVVPARPPGSWYAVCYTLSLAGILSQELGGTPERPMEEFSVCNFQAGEDSTSLQLKAALERIGFDVNFANTPPWLETTQ